VSRPCSSTEIRATTAGWVRSRRSYRVPQAVAADPRREVSGQDDARIRALDDGNARVPSRVLATRPSGASQTVARTGALTARRAPPRNRHSPSWLDSWKYSANTKHAVRRERRRASSLSNPEPSEAVDPNRGWCVRGHGRGMVSGYGGMALVPAIQPSLKASPVLRGEACRR
jgi:hypothetical protein